MPSEVKTNNQTTEANKEAIADAAKERAFQKFKADGKQTLMSLNSSTSEVLDFINRSMNDKDRTPAWDIAMQEMTAERNRMLTMISNIMRAIADGANAVIRNIRA